MINATPANRTWIGILLFCGTTLCFAALDTGAKFLTQDYHPLQVVWGRYFFQFVLLLPVFARQGFHRSFASARPGVQIARGLLISLITFLFFASISQIALVDAQAISFTMPLILTALAFVFLGEKVGPRRWAAVLFGFLGVVLVIRPTGSSLQWAALLCLASAALNAGFHLMTRTLAAADPPNVGIAYAGTIGTIIFTFVVPFVWITPTAQAWFIFAAIGALGMSGHYWLSKSYIYARAVVLAPYVYLQIVWVAIFGFLLFGTVPSVSTLVGAGIVIASGIYVFHRERLARGEA
ncbi:MAG: EamA family transporter [Alphaproteobacteria bacterium]|nr:EamA family transporter [Alphaproteobacteria bacterium]